MSENAIAMERTRPNIDLTDHAVTLVIVCLVGLVMNTVGPAGRRVILYFSMASKTKLGL